MSDDPIDRIERELDEFLSHSDPAAFMRQRQEQREREHLELQERLQVQRENGPRYWKRLYENLLATIEAEREAERRGQKEWWNFVLGAIFFCAVFAAVWFIIDRVL